MRNIKIFIFLICSLFSISSFCQEKYEGNLKVTGTLYGFAHLPKKVLFSIRNLNMQTITYDSTEIVNQKFIWGLKILEPKQVTISLFFPNSKPFHKTFWAFADNYFFELTNKNMEVSISGTSVPKADPFLNLTEKSNEIRRKKEIDIKTMDFSNMSSETINRKIDEIRDSTEIYIDEFIYKQFFKENTNNVVGLWALNYYAEHPLENPRKKKQTKDIKDLFSMLGADVKGLPLAKELQNKLILASRLHVGNKYVDLKLASIDGKSYKLSQIKGKYTLIDFWASWCTPCRAENPLLISLFKKYNTSGFKIVSITLDEKGSRQNWINAIKKDGTNMFANFSDFDKKAITTYDIRAIPSNILIDNNGKIIAKDIRGAELKNTIIKLFEAKN